MNVVKYTFRYQQLSHRGHRRWPCLKDVRLYSVQQRFLTSDPSGAFTDRVVIRVTGGRGGNGCASFARGPNQEIAPPDGGHGGDGGSVWIQADSECRSLRLSTALVRGKHGTSGRGAKMRGHNGDDVIVKVPCGTVVSEFTYPTSNTGSGVVASPGGDDMRSKSSSSSTVEEHRENETVEDLFKSLGEKKQSGGVSSFEIDGDSGDTDQIDRMINRLRWEIQLEEKGIDPSTVVYDDAQDGGANTKAKADAVKQTVCELNDDEQRVLVAEGGRGGRGNMSFKNSTNRSPTEAENGAPGQHRRLELELKTIADVGLVGFPNAGKSTLLRAVSRAKPRVAAYPFTTLRPHIGMVYPGHAPPQQQQADVPQQHHDHQQQQYETAISVADIPGLIEGAHEDKGLGHDFLRHIERTAFLVYVIDVTTGPQRACAALSVLKRELDLYLPGLASRASCVVANKMDVRSRHARDGLLALLNAVGEQTCVFPVSAKYGVGVGDVVAHLGAQFGVGRRKEATVQDNAALS